MQFRDMYATNYQWREQVSTLILPYRFCYLPTRSQPISAISPTRYHLPASAIALRAPTPSSVSPYLLARCSRYLATHPQPISAISRHACTQCPLSLSTSKSPRPPLTPPMSPHSHTHAFAISLSTHATCLLFISSSDLTHVNSPTHVNSLSYSTRSTRSRCLSTWSQPTSPPSLPPSPHGRRCAPRLRSPLPLVETAGEWGVMVLRWKSGVVDVDARVPSKEATLRGAVPCMRRAAMDAMLLCPFWSRH